jgi:hypothetical protein
MKIWDNYNSAKGEYTYLDVVSDDNSGDGNNALCSFTTTSGTIYYIKITARSSTSGEYTLVVE